MPGKVREGFPGGSDSKASACNAGDPGSIPGSGISPGEGNGPTPVLVPGQFHGLRRLVGYSPWGCKESDTTELSFSGLGLGILEGKSNWPRWW